MVNKNKIDDINLFVQQINLNICPMCEKKGLESVVKYTTSYPIFSCSKCKKVILTEQTLESYNDSFVPSENIFTLESYCIITNLKFKKIKKDKDENTMFHDISLPILKKEGIDVVMSN